MSALGVAKLTFGDVKLTFRVAKLTFRVDKQITHHQSLITAKFR